MSLPVPVDTWIAQAKICQYLWANDTSKKKIFQGRNLAPQYMQWLFVVRSLVEFQYNRYVADSSYSDGLVETSQYMYSLMGKFQNQAANILDTGGSVVPPPVGQLTAYWLAMDTNPYPTISGGTDPYTYNDSINFIHNANLVFPVASGDSNRYFIFKVPTGETLKTHYQFSIANSGDIPNPAMRSKLTIADYDYYLSRQPLAYSAGDTLTLS